MSLQILGSDDIGLFLTLPIIRPNKHSDETCLANLLAGIGQVDHDCAICLIFQEMTWSS